MYYRRHANVTDILILDLMEILPSPRGNRLLIVLIVNSAQLSSFCWVQKLVEWDWIWLELLTWSYMISTGIQLLIFRSDIVVYCGMWWASNELLTDFEMSDFTCLIATQLSPCAWTNTITEENSEKKKKLSVVNVYICITGTPFAWRV